MSSPQKKVFGFFDLPRELRDQVYPLFRGGGKTSQRSQNFRCFGVTQFPTYLVNALLVSRQFSQEYQQALQQYPSFQTLTLSACDKGDETAQQGSIQPVLRKRLAEIVILRIVIPVMVLHAESSQGESNAIRQDLEHDMRTLYALMPSLKNIVLESILEISWMDLYLTHTGTVEQLSTIPTDRWLFQGLPSNAPEMIDLERRLVLVARLYEPNPYSMNARTAIHLINSRRNAIFYLCKPSESSYSYRGFELEQLEPVGTFEQAWAEATAGKKVT